MTVHIQNVELPGARARALLDEVEAHDGVAAFSEQFLQALDDARVDHTHLIAFDSAEAESNGVAAAEIVGIAGLATDGSVELAVGPRWRRQAIATQLIAAAREEYGARVQPGFWAHGDLPAAQSLARKEGLEKTRELLVMAVDGAELAAAAKVELPEGYELLDLTQASERFGRETVERDWLAVNNDAFSWHPEQGGWDVDRLRRGMDTEWFDERGVWLLYKGDTLAGFHWTKRHPGDTGEVYVVGLSSAFRGEGLGGPLVSAGLAHLMDTGSTQVILYVEADNVPAVKRYERLGFEVSERHVVYQ